MKSRPPIRIYLRAVLFPAACLLALACAADLLPPASPYVYDAVANGGFEHGRAQGGNDAVAGWFFPNAGVAACEIVYDTSAPKTGGACLTMKDVAAYAEVAQELHTDYLAGRRATVEAYIKPTPDAVAWVGIAEAGRLFSPAPVFLPPNKWSRVVYEVRIPDTQEPLSAVCYATATASFDGVKVTVPLEADEEDRVAKTRARFRDGLDALAAGGYPEEASDNFQRCAALLAGVETYDDILDSKNFAYDRWSIYAALVSNYNAPGGDRQLEFDAGVYPPHAGIPFQPFHLSIDRDAAGYNRDWVYSDYGLEYEGLERTTTFAHHVAGGRLSFSFTASQPPGTSGDVNGVLVGDPWLEITEQEIEGKRYYAVALWCYSLNSGAVSAPGLNFGAGVHRAAPFYAQYGTGPPFLLGYK